MNKYPFDTKSSLRPRTRAILKRLPPDQELVGVEVGVWKGHNILPLLRERPLVQMFLVDRWMPTEPDSNYGKSQDKCSLGTQAEWNHCLQKLIHNLLPYWDRISILQLHSEDAARGFHEQSLDFVFIDGDHTAPQVGRDIAAWSPKVKPGGWLCGHDYRPDNGVAGANPYGVIEAVDSFIEDTGLTLELDQDNTWFIKMPSVPAADLLSTLQGHLLPDQKVRTPEMP